MFKKVQRYIKQQPLTVILGCLLIVQILMIAVCNIKLIDNNVDCDNAKLFVHIREMWEQKTWFLPSWVYMTTLEIDCSSLLALPLYGVTGNIYLAFGLANIILLGIFIAAVFYLFWEKPFVYPVLAMNLICIPYSMGMLDYFNMLFFAGAQYIIKVLVPLLIIAILVHQEKNSGVDKKVKITIFILFCFLLFITSLSSGVYVFVCGVVPVLLVYGLYKLFRYEKIKIGVWVQIDITVILAAIGISLNGVLMGGAKGNDMTMIGVDQFWNNALSCILGIFELFGGICSEADVPVISLQGISVLSKACLTLVYFACAAIGYRKLIKKQGSIRILFLGSVFVWNLFVLLITDASYGAATYEYRYHLMGMIPVVCITSEILLDSFTKWRKWQKFIMGAVGVTALLIVNGCAFKVALDTEDKQAELRAVCNYCEDLDAEYVYLFLDTAASEICRCIGNTEVEYLCLTGEGKTTVYDYYSEYEGKHVQMEAAVVVVDDVVFNLGDYFEQGGYKFQKFATVAGRSLYQFVD